MCGFGNSCSAPGLGVRGSARQLSMMQAAAWSGTVWPPDKATVNCAGIWPTLSGMLAHAERTFGAGQRNTPSPQRPCMVDGLGQGCWDTGRGCCSKPERARAQRSRGILYPQHPATCVSSSVPVISQQPKFTKTTCLDLESTRYTLRTDARRCRRRPTAHTSKRWVAQTPLDVDSRLEVYTASSSAWLQSSYRQGGIAPVA